MTSARRPNGQPSWRVGPSPCAGWLRKSARIGIHQGRRGAPRSLDLSDGSFLTNRLRSCAGSDRCETEGLRKVRASPKLKLRRSNFRRPDAGFWPAAPCYQSRCSGVPDRGEILRMKSRSVQTPSGDGKERAPLACRPMKRPKPLASRAPHCTAGPNSPNPGRGGRAGCGGAQWSPALAQAVEELRGDNRCGQEKARLADPPRGVAVSTSTVGRILTSLMQRGVVTPVPTLRRKPGGRRFRLVGDRWATSPRAPTLAPPMHDPPGSGGPLAGTGPMPLRWPRLRRRCRALW